MGAVCLLGFTILFPETCRNVVGNGSKSPQKWNKPLLSFFCPSNQERRATVPGLSRIPNPFKCIVIMKSRENSLILASNALFYMNYSSMQAALAPLVIEYYDLSSLDSGLCYIAYGVATVLSSFAVGMSAAVPGLHTLLILANGRILVQARCWTLITDSPQDKWASELIECPETTSSSSQSRKLVCEAFGIS